MVNNPRNLGAAWIAAACALMSALPVQAEPTGQAQPYTVSDVDAIMQEEILLKARVARAKQQAELVKFDADLDTPSQRSRSLPQVAWRRATATGWLAKFVLQDGTSVIAGPNEPLPGGWKVARIAEAGVQLRRDGELIDLSAATTGDPIQPAPTQAAGLTSAYPGNFSPSALRGVQ